MRDNLFKYKAFYRFDSLDNLTINLDENKMISIIDSDSSLFINCPVFVLRNDLRFLLRLDVQVYYERPYTFYL